MKWVMGRSGAGKSMFSIEEELARLTQPGSAGGTRMATTPRYEQYCEIHRAIHDPFHPMLVGDDFYPPHKAQFIAVFQIPTGAVDEVIDDAGEEHWLYEMREVMVFENGIDIRGPSLIYAFREDVEWEGKYDAEPSQSQS